MKRMSRKFFAVLLVCLTAALWTAPAWAYPKWVGSKATWVVKLDEKNKNLGKGTEKVLKISVTYTNNSKDKLIKAFYNRTHSFYCEFYVKDGQNEVYLGSVKRDGEKFDNPWKVEVYPGQSVKRDYTFGLDLSKWSDVNRRAFNNSKQILIRNGKWTHDFQVRMEEM